MKRSQCEYLVIILFPAHRHPRLPSAMSVALEIVELLKLILDYCFFCQGLLD